MTDILKNIELALQLKNVHENSMVKSNLDNKDESKAVVVNPVVVQPSPNPIQPSPVQPSPNPVQPSPNPAQPSPSPSPAQSSPNPVQSSPNPVQSSPVQPNPAQSSPNPAQSSPAQSNPNPVQSSPNPVQPAIEIKQYQLIQSSTPQPKINTTSKLKIKITPNTTSSVNQVKPKLQIKLNSKPKTEPIPAQIVKQVKPMQILKVQTLQPNQLITSIDQLEKLSLDPKQYEIDEDEDDKEVDYSKPLNIKYEYVPAANNWSMIEYLENRPPVGWRNFFRTNYHELQLAQEKVNKKKAELGVYFPQIENIFKIFYMCPLRKIKVVVVGQDPYHQLLANGKCRAQGYSFGVDREDDIPSSLQYIYKELQNCYPDFRAPEHGDITSWIEQGVFMYNATLTVAKGQANSHADAWLNFSKFVIKTITEINNNVVFLLWGGFAKKLVEQSDVNSKVLQVCASHPSGLGANQGIPVDLSLKAERDPESFRFGNRTKGQNTRFVGSKCFIAVNKLLQQNGQQPIDWQN